MVFKRKIYDKLKQWKELSGGSSAVLLEGARRIGKSTIVEEFAKSEYDDYMILDFAKEGKTSKTISWRTWMTWRLFSETFFC